MKQLVYLSPVPWKSFAQRPHKFVEWFHATTKGDVLWVDHYPTRFPKLSDIRRLITKPTLENDKSPSWLKVLRIPALPIEPLPGSGLLNGILWQSAFSDIAQFIAQQPTLLVMGQPSVLGLMLLERHPNISSVYDAMDDFPAFYSGFSRLAMAWREKKVASHITYLMVSSTALKQRWSKVRTDVKLVPNGLDASVLPSTIREKRVGESNILGYVGTIGPWFDWDWIIALAKVRSQDVIRLIGPLLISVPLLPDNIQILPACTHHEALVAMQAFDVGLIPFKDNHLTTSVDPIKYYEYRALGLPVISTAFGEMVLREDEAGTFLSRQAEDLNGLVQKALQYSPNPAAIDQFIVNNTWEMRFAAAHII